MEIRVSPQHGGQVDSLPAENIHRFSQGLRIGHLIPDTQRGLGTLRDHQVTRPEPAGVLTVDVLRIRGRLAGGAVMYVPDVLGQDRVRLFDSLDEAVIELGVLPSPADGT